MSSDVAVRVQRLTKTYVLRHQLERESTLAETLLKRARSGGRSRSKETFSALRDVSFEVRPGDVVGVIGRNGAGKSTLLKVLSRITAPTGGRVEIHGRLGSLLEVGTGFHPELTGRENIFLNGTILGMRRREISGVYDDIVEFSGVERFLDTPVKRYSSGMYVRLAFAVAAHMRTDVLLIDEVLAVGDADFQKRCLGKMESLAGEGRAVLFVSHSLETVSRLCKRGILMADGQVVLDGPVSDVIARYVSNPEHSSARRVWSDSSAPGDETASLLAVELVDANGQSATSFDIRRPVVIRVRYRLHSSAAAPLVSLLVKDAEGHLLFSTNSTHASRPSSASGVVQAECTVPGNFLAEGSHLVTAMLNSHNSVHVHEEDVVGFAVHDPGLGDSVRGAYSGDWGGMVRPMLPWSLSTLPEPEDRP